MRKLQRSLRGRGSKWVALGLALIAFSQMAYVRKMLSHNVPEAWNRSRPIVVKLWSGLSQSSSIQARENVRAWVTEAVERWTRSAGLNVVIGDDSYAGDVREDGSSLITIAPSSANRSMIPEVALGTTYVWKSNGKVTEADVLLNPAQSWTASRSGSGYNLLQTVSHEFGHAIGFGHAIDRGSVMYFQGGWFRRDFSRLTWDDIAGANESYPLRGMDLITGTVMGSVTLDGRAVFGAFVSCVDEDGILVANGATLPDGSYRIANLPPGRYALYVEPLDGPMYPGNLNVGLASNSLMTNNFNPQFYLNSRVPNLQVKAGGMARADFRVMRGQTRYDPGWARVDADPYNTGGFTPLTVEVSPGQQAHLGIAGDGVGSLPSSNALYAGPHFQIGNMSRSKRNTSGIDFKWYQFAVSPEAPEGFYSLFTNTGTELGVMSGVIGVYEDGSYATNFPHFAHVPESIETEVLLIGGDRLQHTRGSIEFVNREGGGLSAQSGLEPAFDGPEHFDLAPASSRMLHSNGSRGFSGAIQVRATTNLAAVSVIRTPIGSASLLPSRPSHYFMVPVHVDMSSSINTGVALFNTERREGSLFLQLSYQDGSPVDSLIIDLEARASRSLLISDLFPSVGDHFLGTLTVTSYRRINASVIRTGTGIFTTFPVIENRVTTRSYFAQFAAGGDFHSELWLMNPSPAGLASNVQVQVRDDSGQPAEIVLNGVELPQGRGGYRIPAGGLLRLTSGSQNFFVGSVEVNSDVPVGGVLLFSASSFGDGGIGESPVLREALMPIMRSRQAGINTGVALYNTEARPVSLQLELRDEQGTSIETRQLQLDPHQQLARFLTDNPLELNLPAEFNGSLWVQASGLVAMTVMRQEPGSVAALPVFDSMESDLPRQ